MGFRLTYSKPAARDLQEIVQYIAHDNPKAAMELGLKLVELAESLTQMPRRGTLLRSRPGVRRVLQLPYLVVYRIDEERQMIRILRFWHAKRDPQSLGIG